MSTAPVPAVPGRALWRRVIAAPSTRAGRRAAWLVGAAMGVLALDGGLIAAGAPEWGWAAHGAVVAGSLAAVAAAIVSGAMAVRSLVQGERSIVVLAPLVFGGICLTLLLAEFLSYA